MDSPRKTLTIMMILIFVYMVVLSVFLFRQPAKVVESEKQTEIPVVKTGQYTIFQYTTTGWCNPRYATEYYIQDRIIYYKLRENKGEYLELSLEGCLIENGWIEGAEELSEYGHWSIGCEEW
ncbi:MAG TPA: hypothetical protein VN549_00685 [Negativicutes bacterium]|nr:hypothetical protein [Negativicutes bacterium]